MAIRKEYRIGKRLIVFRNIFYILATALLVCFYFIYDYIFGNAFPMSKGLPMLALFVLLELLVIAAGRWWCVGGAGGGAAGRAGGRGRG